MIRSVKRWISCVALTAMLASCATMPEKKEDQAQNDYSYTKEYITWLIKKEMKKQDVTGLSIALLDDQRVIWAEGFGFADKANKIPAKPETIYRAGSISKLFTATAAMQLAEQGKLDIDKPLQTYIPEFSIKSRFPKSDPITPRSIMTHHSGLPSDLIKGMWINNPEPFENIVKGIREDYVANPPNLVFSYSNLGVTLLGLALERVTGQAFASYMDGALLSPLGMTQSSFAQGIDHSPLSAKAYRQGEESAETPLRDLPAGGLNTSVLDLGRFMRMVFANGRSGEQQIIQAETLAEMLRPQNIEVALDFDEPRIGLAWFLDDTAISKAGLAAMHGGDTRYHHSFLMVLPDHKLGVVVLANSDGAASVVPKVAIETLKLALEAKTKIKQPPEDKKKETAVVTLPPETLQAYSGRYVSQMGLMKISSKSDKLQVEAGGKTLHLIPHADGFCYLRYKLLGLIPISLGKLGEAGFSLATIGDRDILKTTVEGKASLFGERIVPVPIPPQWLGRTGSYQIINAENEVFMVEDIRLEVDDGLLIAKYAIPFLDNTKVQMALKPVDDSQAVIYGLGRGLGETIQAVTHGGEELLRYSGYLFRKQQE